MPSARAADASEFMNSRSRRLPPKTKMSEQKTEEEPARQIISGIGLDEDDGMDEIEVARHPRMIVKIPCNVKVKENDMMRLKVFDIKDYL